MEYLDIYDHKGNLTGNKEEKETTHKLGLWHKTIHLWILNDKNELLMQRRSKDNPRYPNQLEISVAGHIRSGEDSIEALERETFEELGIKINPYFIEYLFSYKHQKVMGNNYINNEISDVYVYHYPVKIEDCKFFDSSVSEVVYIPYEELEKRWKEKDSEIIDHDEHYTILFCMLKKYIVSGKFFHI